MTIAMKPKFIQAFLIVTFLSLTPILVGCEEIATSTAKLSLNVTAIENLQKRRADTKVYVKGVVESHAPFLGAGAYQLQDKTGEVWVFTTNSLPELGQEMLVRGAVSFESITLEELKDQDIGGVYLQELERIQEPTSEEGEEEVIQPQTEPVSNR
ncbi:MAG: hypothetical protein SWJ54_08985 [Cyanobacteriota bacterium]|nr:hypothetical protein [Cyanobacteriota bacterium]